MATGRKKIDPSLKRLKTGVSLSPQLMGDIDFLVSLTNSSRSAVLEAAAADYIHDISERLHSLNNLANRDPDKPFAISDPVILSFIRHVQVVARGSSASSFMFLAAGGAVDD